MNVSFTGSAELDQDFQLEERVMLLVEGWVSQHGEKATASQGTVDFAKIRIGTVIVTDGAERNALLERVAAARHDDDQLTIDAELDDEPDF